MAKFKVGDVIERIDGDTFSKGRATVKVDRVDGKQVWIEGGTNVNENNVRLVGEREPLTTPITDVSALKVGDWVIRNSRDSRVTLAKVSHVLNSDNVGLCGTNREGYEVSANTLCKVYKLLAPGVAEVLIEELFT
jgi:hypothetical protein